MGSRGSGRSSPSVEHAEKSGLSESFEQIAPIEGRNDPLGLARRGESPVPRVEHGYPGLDELAGVTSHNDESLDQGRRRPGSSRRSMPKRISAKVTVLTNNRSAG